VISMAPYLCVYLPHVTYISKVNSPMSYSLYGRMCIALPFKVMIRLRAEKGSCPVREYLSSEVKRLQAVVLGKVRWRDWPTSHTIGEGRSSGANSGRCSGRIVKLNTACAFCCLDS
jgi:hypothetical protein